MTAYLKYINGLLDIIKKGRPYPLKEVIEARLNGKTEPVHGLVSPGLARDEHDKNAIFYYVYQKLSKMGDRQGVEELRRVIVDMLITAFCSKKNIDIIDSLGQMAGFFQVKESPVLAEQMRLQLWGYLNSKIPKPLNELIHLEGDQLEYASRALDLWMAVSPLFPGEKDARYYDDIKQMFQEGLRLNKKSNPHFKLLLLMYRAVMKTDPEYAGRNCFRKIIEFVERFKDNNLDRSWFNLCREYGVIFRQNKDGKKWKELFKKGIINDDQIKLMITNTLTAKSLYLMDGINKEINKIPLKAEAKPISIKKAVNQ